MKTFVAYYRVSTKKQEYGIEAQRKAAVEYAERVGGAIIEEYVEKESGGKNNRPKLLQAMAQAKSDGATLLIAKLDRLSRNAAFLLGLRDSGVPFVCADMPDATHLTVGIMAVMAEEERRLISERTKAGLAVARKKGKKLGRPEGTKQPDNWDHAATMAARREKYITKHKDALAIIKNQREGGATFTSIAAFLNDIGFGEKIGRDYTTGMVQNLYAKYGKKL